MLTLLLCTGMLLSPEAETPKTAKTEKTETLKDSKKDTEESAPKSERASDSKAPERKVAPRRSVRGSPDVQRRLAEAEAKASRLSEENARLQQEVARGQGLPSITVASPDAALKELKSGNARFVEGKRLRTLLSLQDPELRGSLSKGQAPFAIIVTCSDSRLVDNLIFDQELGRLFTIREAGNSSDIQGIASAEYAAEHLGSKLVVVMGHTSCGAVKAVAESHGKPLPGNLWSLQAAMAGLLESTPEDPNESAADYYTHLSEHNAQRQAQAMLARSEILRELVKEGKLKVVPALYELNSGLVKFLELPKADDKVEGHH